MFFSKLIPLTSSFLPKIILLMGGPGSGKGVLAKNLFKMNHFSIGEALRIIIQDSKHPQAESFKKRIELGHLLEDQDILQVLQNSEVLKQSNPVLLDGFPRTLLQWQLFKQHYGMPVFVIDLEVSEECMRKRLLARGRNDDQETVINTRVDDYFNNTQPMAKKIAAEVHDTLHLDTSTLDPFTVSSIVKEFLTVRNLYPREIDNKNALLNNLCNKMSM